jgi:MoaA/NifB/PqqE/SkfB family radical SAM enzyme
VSHLIRKTTETLLPDEAVQRLRTAREWRRWVDGLTPEVLKNLTKAPPEVKRLVFKATVRRVEIETHARCNRICSFCPNVIIDRRLNQTLTDAQILDRVFEDLGGIDYAGQIVVARYSEPLANRPYLYDRLARARALVPQAQLCITTNTDYLTPAVLDKLEESGLNVVYMSLYLRNRERWSIELARAYTERLEKKLGARVLTKVEMPTNLLATYRYKGLDLRSTCHNWHQYGTDRGGSLPQYQQHERVGPCRDPFETFVVDYNGSVVPCCAIRSDLPEHRDLVVGNLSVPGTSIFDVYAGQLSAWRRGMVGFGHKGFPCTTCRHRDLPDDLVGPISRRLEKRLHQIGRAADYRPPVVERKEGETVLAAR